MSELKAETIVPQGTAITLQMYPKSEADLYIAHQKYKRCDAMAKRYEVEYKLAKYLAYKSNKEIKAYKRWQKWLELAEHYKEMAKCT